MTDETKTDKKERIFKIAGTEEEVVEDVIDEELAQDTINEQENLEVKQLQKFRNVKLYLNKMIGKEWLLMYRREEDGSPIFVPNEYLNYEDQVFLGELAKQIVFQMMSFEGEVD